jgi:hypothetical protein
MKKILNASAATLAALLLSGCISLEPPPPPPATNAKPAWIDNPGNGVSESAGFNVMGSAAQEELAISRARAEFANRFGVDVESVQLTQTTVHNDQASTDSQHNTQIVTSQKDVKARVKEKWRDPVNNILWVWLVPSDQ